MSAESTSPFNLEHLKKDAKRRLQACRAGNPEAVAAMQARLPGLRRLNASDVPRTVRLADVQHAIALERGFRSWADLARLGDPVARLLVAIRGYHVATLRRDLAGFAGAVKANAFAAGALGDTHALQTHLEDDPSLATSVRDGWTPLDYVCGSPLARFSPRHATSLCDCAALLLDAGADPGRSIEDSRLPGSPTPAIMRAGLSGNFALVVLLGKRGAKEPHDRFREWVASRSSDDHNKLHQFFGEYFKRPEIRAHMQSQIARIKEGAGLPANLPLDPREQQQLHMPNLVGARQDLWTALLDRGLDPTLPSTTGRTMLHNLVTYAPASFVEMVLDRGVDALVRDVDGRSVIGAAIRAGNLEVAEVLRSRGLVDDSTVMDQLIGRCLAGDEAGARALAADHAGILAALSRTDAEELVRAAARGEVAQVRLMLDCGFAPNAAGESGATALQQAAWRGQIEVVDLLLARGASADHRDELYGETAVEWAWHGAAHAQGAQSRCLQAVKTLEREQ